MEKKIVFTESAPAPIGPYSQAVLFGNLLLISGQIPLHPVTGEMVQDTIEAETRQVMENLKSILDTAGYGFEHVLKTSIFLMDMAQFKQVNEVYGQYFKTNPPARETIQVAGLPKNANVEISMIAGK